MNEDGTLKIERDRQPDLDYSYNLKCNYCSKDVMNFNYESCTGSHEIFDKKAIIVCSGCKGKLI